MSQVSSNLVTSWFRSFVELIWNDPVCFNLFVLPNFFKKTQNNKEVKKFSELALKREEQLVNSSGFLLFFL